MLLKEKVFCTAFTPAEEDEGSGTAWKRSSRSDSIQISSIALGLDIVTTAEQLTALTRELPVILDKMSETSFPELELFFHKSEHLYYTGDLTAP